MAAGLGFKTFTTGEVLTADNVNGYLMQGVLVFASAAARTSAITSPQEGQYSYLKDTNALEYYDGANWVGAPVGDITAVTAGTGISGGGSSGDVTITNSMATAIDAKGDLVVGTGADAFSRLAVGANGTIAVADSTTATGLKWAVSGNVPTCRVYASSSQSISNATDTKIAFANETFDTDGFHSNVTNNTRITIPAGLAGYYRVTANIGFLSNASGRRIFAISLNGGNVSQAELTPTASVEPAGSITDTYILSDGDYLELNVYQTSGGSLNTSGSTTRDFFEVERIGS
jgi:hypothetical protein